MKLFVRIGGAALAFVLGILGNLVAAAYQQHAFGNQIISWESLWIFVACSVVVVILIVLVESIEKKFAAQRPPALPASGPNAQPAQSSQLPGSVSVSGNKTLLSDFGIKGPNVTARDNFTLGSKIHIDSSDK